MRYCCSISMEICRLPDQDSTSKNARCQPAAVYSWAQLSWVLRSQALIPLGPLERFTVYVAQRGQRFSESMMLRRWVFLWCRSLAPSSPSSWLGLGVKNIFLDKLLSQCSAVQAGMKPEAGSAKDQPGCIWSRSNFAASLCLYATRTIQFCSGQLL